MMQNPRLDPTYDSEGRPRVRGMQATEMRLEVEEVMRDKKRMIEGLSRFTGRSVDAIARDFKRDFYLNAYEASQYGITDQILMPKRSTKVATAQDIKFGSFGGSGEEQRFQAPSAPTSKPGDDDRPPALG